MQQGDLIRITDVQVLDGYTREMLNVYYYTVVTMTGEVPLPLYTDDLATAFKHEVIEVVRLVQTSALKHVRVEFFNMTHQLEEATYEYDPAIAGAVGGDYPPGNLTYSFRLQRYDRTTRNGRKGIPGVADIVVGAGRTLNPAYSAAISQVSAALGHYITVEGESVDATLLPTIVRVPDNPGVIPTQTNPVTRAFYRGFGTQNSRKEL